MHPPEAATGVGVTPRIPGTVQGVNYFSFGAVAGSSKIGLFM